MNIGVVFVDTGVIYVNTGVAYVKNQSNGLG